MSEISYSGVWKWRELRTKEQILQARIAQLEEQLRWIPVSERLPNEDYCIAIVEYLSGHRTRKLLQFENNRGFGLYDIESDNIDGWVNYNDNVTHWMPLPNPPELPTPEVSE